MLCIISNAVTQQDGLSNFLAKFDSPFALGRYLRHIQQGKRRVLIGDKAIQVFMF